MMPVAKITEQGMFAIALCVALLWSCLIGERLMLHRAETERVRILHDMERLRTKPRPMPVNAPMPAASRRSFVTAA
jgi:hypothetical protein